MSTPPGQDYALGLLLDVAVALSKRGCSVVIEQDSAPTPPLLPVNRCTKLGLRLIWSHPITRGWLACGSLWVDDGAALEILSTSVSSALSGERPGRPGLMTST